MKRFRLFRRETPVEQPEETPAEAVAQAERHEETTEPRFRFPLFRREKPSKAETEPEEPAVQLGEPHVKPRRRFWPPMLRRRADAAPVEDEPADVQVVSGRTRALPWRRRADPPAPAEAEATQMEISEKPRRRLRPRLSFPWRPRPRVLLFALLMFGAAAVGVLLNLGIIPGAVGDLWPLALAAAGAVLLPGALRRRDGGRLLLAFALGAVGVSLLLAETELFPIEMTLATALLIALGFTAMVRAVLTLGAE